MSSWNASDTAAPDWLVDYDLTPEHKLVKSHDEIVKRFVGNVYDSTSNRVNNYQFMIAPARAGASPHFHYTSARLMVYGRARYAEQFRPNLVHRAVSNMLLTAISPPFPLLAPQVVSVAPRPGVLHGEAHLGLVHAGLPRPQGQEAAV